MGLERHHSSLRATAVLALFIIITILAIHTGMAAPQAQTEEPELTPTPQTVTEPTPTPEQPTLNLLPTLVPQPELLAAAFEVTFSPDPVAPGDQVTASWNFRDFQGSLDGVELWFTLPVAFLPLDGGSLSFDPTFNQLIIPLREAEGSLSWYVDANAQPPFDCLVEVRANGQVLRSLTHSLGLHGPDLVGLDGGEASGYNGDIRVSFPAGALPEAADVLVRPPRSPELSLGGNPVELTAIGRASGMAITHFNQPVTITIQYTDEQAQSQLESVGMLDERSLALFYYDETLATWRPLTTTVDPQANLLTAVTDHFTLFDFMAQNWEAARLPSMAGFQVDSFTGAGTYSIPIQVPAGPAGLQPSLTLTYNSQVVDGASSRSQASWVGMGWSLDTGYIQRSMNGTPNYLEDDTFALQANGVGGMLLPIPDQDGDPNTIDYHLADENFWRVRQYVQSETIGMYIYDRSYWVVYAPDGTRYTYGRLADGQSHLASYPAYLEGCSPIYVTAWQWPVTQVENIFGQRLTYLYTGEVLTKRAEGCLSGTYTTVALYPSQIIYPNNRYRIVFEREAGRLDYDPTWAYDDQATILFMSSRLQHIQIWHDPDGVWDTGDKQLVREYVLEYGENGQQIMPGNTWPAGGLTPTLTSLTEYGLYGSESLPITTFTYDELHLLQVENGYGGRVNINYSEWHAANGLDDISCDYIYGAITTRVDIITTYPLCHDIHDVFPQYYQPGGSYLVNLEAKNVGGAQIKVGFDPGTSDAWSAEQSIPADDSYHAMSFQVSVPGNALQARPLLYCTNCEVRGYEIIPLLTRYQVASKALTDQVASQTDTWTYGYTGAAVNDPAHSALAATWSDGVRLLIDPYAEFRGHAQVTITAPDGGYTVSYFDQSDLYKGRLTRLDTFTSGGALLSRVELQYDHTGTVTGSLPHPFSELPWADLVIEWVHPTQQTSYTYNGDSTWVAARTWYEYNPSEQGGVQYGNLTRVLASQWDSQAGAWRDYRLTRTLYYPNNQPGGVYLTGLAAVVESYACPSGMFNGTCSSGYPGNPPASWLKGMQWNLYDNHHPPAYPRETSPSVGVLTGTRQLLSCLNNDCATLSNQRFSDQLIGYDAWGNRTTASGYSGVGTSTAIASIGVRTTAVCSGGGGQLAGYTCTDDGYHTYPLWERNALGHLTSLSYDYNFGVPVSITDPNNIPTLAGYDGFGRITSIVRFEDSISYPTMQFSYHEPAQAGIPFYTEARQRIDGELYFTIRKYYSGLGGLLETQVLGAELSTGTQDVVVSQRQSYQLVGGQLRLVQQQSVPYAIPAGYGFRGWNYVIANTIAHSDTALDELGRPVTITVPDGSQTSYTYSDGYGSAGSYIQVDTADALGRHTLTWTDLWGRTIRVIPTAEPGTTYTYDTFDRLVSTVYGSAVTGLTYDLSGRKTAMDDPDMGDWSYAYNALGNLLSQTDARGCTTTLTYDLLNRLTGKSYSGSCGATTPAVTYTYDVGVYAVGHRTGMIDGSCSTSWAYDERGRVIDVYQSVTGGGNFRTQWEYNSADLPESMIYPANNSGGPGEPVSFTYNPQMLIDKVIGSSIYLDDTWYDPAGRVTLRELGNNYTLGQRYTYYPWTQQGGRLQILESGLAADTDSLQDLSYTYDTVGNVLTITDLMAGGTQVQTFTYDSLYRLSSAIASGGTEGPYDLKNYTYNPDTGNLASNAGVIYTYDSPHPHAVSSTTNGNTYSYDANGNQISRRIDGTTYTLLYDAENRLVQIKRGNISVASYTYDGDGHRVKSVVSNTTTTYIGNYYEYSTYRNTTTKKSYYYAGNQRIAMRQDTTKSTIYFLFTDHLGSTTITANSSGEYVTELLYYPWGGTRYPPSVITPTSYRFTGQREAENSLYYFGARFYDPTLGRFTAPDSLIPDQNDPLSYDRFSYARNNPLRYVDPGGHRTCTPEEVASGDETCDENAQLEDNPIKRLIGTQTSPTQPLCAPDNPDCQPYSDRIWTYDELRFFMALLQPLRDRYAANVIIYGVVLGAAGIATGPAALIGALFMAEFAWEQYNIETLLDYLGEAAQVAHDNGGVRISFYHDMNEYAGIPIVIYFEGSYSWFLVSSPLLLYEFER